MQSQTSPIFVKGGQMYRATSRAWWLPRALKKGDEVVVARIAAEDTFSSYLVDLNEDELKAFGIEPGLICNGNGFVMDGPRPPNNRTDMPISQEAQSEMSDWPPIDRGQPGGAESGWGGAAG